MVTEENLNSIGENLFVSRLPFTYSECGRVIRDAVHADCFEDVGVIAHSKPTRNRPPASYRAAEGKVDGLVKSPKNRVFVIPAKAGIHLGFNYLKILDSVFSRE
jgi:hypothetical protein